MMHSLEGLPFDILFYIASSLQLEDVVHLGRTCAQLKTFLEENTLQRSVVERSPHAREAQLARAGKITYKEALHAIYDRNQALFTAHPFSARILGQGNTFLFRQGVICLLAGDTVQITDVRAKSRAVRLELTSIVRPILESAFAIFGNFKCSLLHYSNNILAIHVESEARPNIGHIFAISAEKRRVHYSRVVTAFQITASSKLFVRHTSRYLYYGTHSGIGADGHHKWEVSGVSLDLQYPLPKGGRPLLFEDFHGTDIGSTIAFEIYDDQFYAVSNQGTFQVEESDWTSFYHCIRFPLNNPVTVAMQKNERVYRRQHAQGPIHDSWTDLSLQVSEQTNEVLILESRREWAKASSRQSRTFYSSKFDVNPVRSSRESSLAFDDAKVIPLPENDIYTNVLDSSNKPNYMATPPQYSWNRHPEFSTADGPSPRSFILAKTKFRAYNYSATTFLDLVEDAQCCNDPCQPPCLRLRIGSRRPTSLHTPTPQDIKGKERAVHSDAPVFADHVSYTHPPIKMWPPPASTCPCAKRLHDILNPRLPLGAGCARSVTGVLDGSTFVYMVKPGRGYGAGDDGGVGSVVVIDFSRRGDQPRGTMASVRCASKTANDGDDGREVACDGGEFDELRWTWKVGLYCDCKKGMCR
ncbi:hypothetical protein BDU57DRAFT_202253 [Ampelomyces quisqualis]|uniref:F-box domain-containing protein n=1 Tax=Ampelomyces quisqualis TaxID=50730 RepID=A0A6A5QUN5_AMPQU|nr:hypothetical protein BDU57DRAFT_202253 [Ampelomyces quisqualis]